MTRRVENFDALPDDARINTSDVVLLTGKSKATIWRWVADGMLPAPASVPEGSRTTHRLGDVRALLRGGRRKAAKKPRFTICQHCLQRTRIEP